MPVWSGFVYVAFAIDLYSRAIVGWEASTVKDTAFVEACLKMALWRRDQPQRRARNDPSQRRGQPIHVHPLHRDRRPRRPRRVDRIGR
ncbi:DDE-type integrase/transposase/recombinase [Frondihabitans sp. PhB188]|uniref:DDE-type integrase/transposase/recombinase n=1 Tax=Frondihabitans sp. PhB188 TaxID=2485200 RepID=UPI000F480739